MATAWSRFRPIVSAWWQRPNLWLLLAVCGLLLYARRPDAFHNPQFWAEDGYFFERNHVVGATAIIQPYNGYLHLVPRLIAAVAGYADPAWIPACYVGAAFLLTLWVAAYTQSQRLHFRAAAGVALAVVLVPDCPDVLLNLPNLQSILGVGLLLLLISDDPDSPARLIHDVAVVVLLGLTGPFIIAFFPLFAWRAWKRRHRPASPSIALAALAAVCAVIQTWMIITHPLPPEADPTIDAAWIFAVPGARLAGSLFAGAFVLKSTSVPVLVLLSAVTLIGAHRLAKHLRHLQTEFYVLLAGGLFLLLSVLFRGRHVLTELAGAGYGSRYFYAPQLVLLWLLVESAAGPSRPAWIARSLLVAALCTNLPRLREPALTDLHWENYAPRIQANENVVIPINPEGWSIPLHPGK